MEQAAQLKGVFGDGASVVAIPESAAARGLQRADTTEASEVATPEQLQLSAQRAQSRGLWTDGGAQLSAQDGQPQDGQPQDGQPKTEKLPRAVASSVTIAPGPANTNYRAPVIGTGDTSSVAPLAMAMGATQTLPPVDAPALGAASGTPPTAAATGAAPAADGVDAASAERAEVTTQSAALPIPEQLTTPVVAAPEEPLRKSQGPGEPKVTGQAAPVRLASSAAPSALRSGVLITLIVLAAIIALMFIGAAAGLWGLPWVSAPAKPGPGHAKTPAHEARSGSAALAPAAATPQNLPERLPQAPADPSEPAASGDAREATNADETSQDPEPDALEATDEATGLQGVNASDDGDDGESLEDEETAEQDAAEQDDPPSLDIAQTLSTARSELRAGDAAAAEALLKPLLVQHPNDHHVAEVMARALLARGATSQALKLTRRIVRKRPKRVSYRILLGDVLRSARNEAGARAAYRAALQLDPQDRVAQSRLQR